MEKSGNKRLDSVTLIVEDLNPESGVSEPDLAKGDPYFHLHQLYSSQNVQGQAVWALEVREVMVCGTYSIRKGPVEELVRPSGLSETRRSWVWLDFKRTSRMTVDIDPGAKADVDQGAGQDGQNNLAEPGPETQEAATRTRARLK